MNRFFHHIMLGCLALFALSACEDRFNEMEPVPAGNGSIIIDFSSAETRAQVADGGSEQNVNHIDIFIFEDNTDLSQRKLFHYCRATGTTAKQGQVKIFGKERKDFVKNQGYWVYLVANSYLPSSEFPVQQSDGTWGGWTYNDLMALVEDTPNISLTGSNADGAPTGFLMEGLAYNYGTDADGNELPEPDADDQGTVVINDGTLSNDTILKAILRRAASKIVIKIHEGDDVDFLTGTNGVMHSQSGYYIQNMPHQATLVSGQTFTSKQMNPDTPYTSYMVYRTETVTLKDKDGNVLKDDEGNDRTEVRPYITVTGYAYPFDWNGKGLEEEVRMAVNIPIRSRTSQNDATVVEAIQSWYQVPISQHKHLQRNTYYEVEVTVNARGATAVSTAVDLMPTFTVKPWTNKNILVGNEATASFLTVNQNTLDMKNISQDFTSLEFFSSSEVKVEVLNFYFIEADGSKIWRYEKGHGGDNSIYTDEKPGDEYNQANRFKQMVSETVPERKITFNGNTTYSAAIADVQKAMNSTAAEAEELVRQNVKFTEKYPYENTGFVKTDKFTTCEIEIQEVNFGNITVQYGSDKETIIGILTGATYNLTPADAEDAFNSAVENKTLKEFTFISTSTTYGGTIKVPVMESYSETIMVDIIEMNYDQASEALVNAGVPQNQVATALGSLPVTGTVVIPAYEFSGEKVVEVKAEPEPGLNGKIKITSPSPANKTARYIVLKVTNTDPNCAPQYITVTQYPLEFISHVVGYYSYRSDFEGTTYEHKGSRIGASSSYSSSTGKVTWTYSNSESDGEFDSKYVKVKDDGSYEIRYYHWNSGSTASTASSTNSVTLDGTHNPRMYRVRVTTNSDQYTLGKPAMNAKGHTDESPANAKVVSPSFMLASQLGAYSSRAINYVLEAAEHCEKYVETYIDPDTNETIHLYDWRLPTQTEIYVIMQYQKKYEDVMATVLTGDNYWAANGLVVTETGKLYNGTGTISSSSNADRAIRCIRDDFGDPPQTNMPKID